MNVKALGFANPIDFNALKKGMLVYSQPSEGQRYFGVISKIRSDDVLVVIASNSEEAAPFVINASAIHNTMWCIRGQLEIEPASGEISFPPISTPTANGLILDASGSLFAVILQREPWGQTDRYIINLATGEHAVSADGDTTLRPYSTISDFSMFVTVDGRKGRFTMPSLTPDR